MFKLTVLLIAFGCASAFLTKDLKYNHTASQSSTGQHTSVEDSIRDLMTMINDEKRIRFQLENRLKTAEDKIDKMDQYNITVSNELEKEKNKVEQLEIMLDKVVHEMERNITAVSNEVEKEKYKVEQLEIMLDTVVREMGRNTSAETVMNQTWLIQMQNSSLKSVQGKSVGFTVNDPEKSAGSVASRGPLKFTHEEYNNQSAYDMTSGKFVCKQAGLYYFTFSILKTMGSANVMCSFNKNGKTREWVYTYANGASDQYTSATNSVLYQLHTGDEVYISGCNEQNHLTQETSFTGFLVSPTN